MVLHVRIARITVAVSGSGSHAADMTDDDQKLAGHSKSATFGAVRGERAMASSLKLSNVDAQRILAVLEDVMTDLECLLLMGEGSEAIVPSLEALREAEAAYHDAVRLSTLTDNMPK